MIRMMPELVESLLVTDVGAFSALVGVATLGAFGLRKQVSWGSSVVKDYALLMSTFGRSSSEWVAFRRREGLESYCYNTYCCWNIRCFRYRSSSLANCFSNRCKPICCESCRCWHRGSYCDRRSSYWISCTFISRGACSRLLLQEKKGLLLNRLWTNLLLEGPHQRKLHSLV